MASEQDSAPTRFSLEGRKSIVSEPVEGKLDAVQELSSTNKSEPSHQTPIMCTSSGSCGSKTCKTSSSTYNEQKKNNSCLPDPSLGDKHLQTTEGTDKGEARPTLAPKDSTSACSKVESVERWRLSSTPYAGVPSWAKEHDRQTFTRQIFLEGVDNFLDLDHSIRDQLDSGTIEHMVLLFNARLDESAMACKSAQQRLQRLSVETRYHMRRYEISISKVKEARRHGKFLEQYLRQRGASILVSDIKDDQFAFPKSFAYTIGPMKL